MAQYQIPGGPFIDDDVEGQFQIPGYQFIDTSVDQGGEEPNLLTRVERGRSVCRGLGRGIF